MDNVGPVAPAIGAGGDNGVPLKKDGQFAVADCFGEEVGGLTLEDGQVGRLQRPTERRCGRGNQ